MSFTLRGYPDRERELHTNNGWWGKILGTAQALGWQQQGTSSQPDGPIDGDDYDINNGAYVSDEDAKNMAAALQRGVDAFCPGLLDGWDELHAWQDADFARVREAAHEEYERLGAASADMIIDLLDAHKAEIDSLYKTGSQWMLGLFSGIRPFIAFAKQGGFTIS